MHASSPTPPDPSGSPTQTHAILIVLCIGIAAILAVLGGGIWLLHSNQTSPSSIRAIVATDGTVPGTTPDGSSAADQSSTNPADQAAGASGGNANGAGGASGAPSGNGAGQASGGAGAPKATTPSGPAPVIVTFHGTEDGTIDCHNTDNPLFSAGWTTTNAVRTTISEDGGAAKAFGPDVETSLAFSCSSPHSYKLTAVSGSGASVSKTLTFTPVNVRPKQPVNDDPTTSNGNPTVTTSPNASPTTAVGNHP